MEPTNFDSSEAGKALDELLQLIDRIPGAARFRKDIQRLKALMVDRRAPRIVIVGRRGHGKSSIANALLGYPKLAVGHVGDQPADEEWVPLEVHGRRLDWLDTSGIGAGGIVGARLDKLKVQVTGAFPDVILLAVKASEVDSEIDATLDGFNSILSVLRSAGCSAPVIVLITKVDELHPARDKEPPFGQSKQMLIAEAVQKLTSHLERHGIKVKATLPLSAYIEFKEPRPDAPGFVGGVGPGSLAALDKTVEFDGRWNIDRLGEVIFSCLPEEAAIEAARAFQSTRSLRQQVGKRIVKLSSAVAFGVGLAPLPIADIAILAPLQLTMVTAISYLSGRKVGLKAITEWMVSLGVVGGAAIALRTLFQELARLIPIAGLPISAAIAGAGTYAIGTSAIAYFIDDESLERAKEIFQKAKKAPQTDWKPPEE